MNINKYTKREQKQIRAMNDRKTMLFIEGERRAFREEGETKGMFEIGDFFKIEGNKITGRM